MDREGAPGASASPPAARAEGSDQDAQASSDEPVFGPVVAFLATFMVLFTLAVLLIPAWLERRARRRPPTD